MALELTVRDELDTYARGDLAGDLTAHEALFDFIGDGDLRRRIGEEYYAARYLYKMWEGLRLDDAWAIRAQVQLQVQQYASIYEACIHHLLFVEAADASETVALREFEGIVRRALPGVIMSQIKALPDDDAAELFGAKNATRRTAESKVRFDHKVTAAVQLGIIDAELGEEIAAFYSARNSIHIHADLKRATDFTWQIDFSRSAYRRLQPFTQQARRWVEQRRAVSQEGVTNVG